MAEEPEITPQQLATFRRCTFARRVFASYPSLWAKKPLGADDLPPDSRDNEWHMSKRYMGEPFDPEEWELREGGWDHEHCIATHEFLRSLGKCSAVWAVLGVRAKNPP